ncbi:TolC family protein [bacterium SCSIO 12741]|nr:TolC family protein [bacterium SCSIO 12741]
MKNLFILILILGVSGIAKAQESWSLEQCINTALERNLNVRNSNLQVDLAETNHLNNKGAFLPSVNLFLNTNLNFGRTIDPFTNTFATDEVRSDAYGVNGRWELFNGLQNVNRYKRGQFDLMAAQYDADKTANDISLQVTYAYLDVLFNEELFKVAQEQVAVTRKQTERTSKLVDAGSLPMGNLMDMQAQLANEELNEVNAQNNMELSYLKLLILMRIDSVTSFAIDKPELNIEDVTSLDATPAFVYNKAVQSLPEVKSAEMRYESSVKALSMERGKMSPSLVLQGSVGSGYSGKNVDPNSAYLTGVETIGVTETGEDVLRPSYDYAAIKPFGDQVNDNFNQSIGFTFTLPILNGLSTHTSISRAKVNREIRQNELDQVKYQINETVKKAYFDAQAALKKYQSNEKAVAANRESYKYAEKRYELGMMNAVEFNQSKNNLIRAESNLLQAKYDYVFKSKILDFYMGKPLTLK